MRNFFVVLCLLAASVRSQLPSAEPCDEEICQLPNCRCSSTDIPGGLNPRDTPQFVLLTFDSAVNAQNIETYRNVVYNRKNTNDCPIGATFFVNHEYNSYGLVNELYNRGFEIGLHSITHKTDQEYWKGASYETLMLEFADQKKQMAHFANIPISSIHGIRSPFFQMSGNSTYQMMSSAELTYDLSWPTIQFRNPGLWPYTLDYKSTQDCIVPPCPTASLPGPWIIPMVAWDDLQNFPCSTVDSCYFNPGSDNETGWFELILKNFERHYLNNRAPFGFHIQEWYVRVNPGLRGALVRFLDMLNNLNDVFMVNANDVVEWVRNPVPINEYRSQACKVRATATCPTTTCSALIREDDIQKVYYMEICSICPRVYPWINNPFGL